MEVLLNKTNLSFILVQEKEYMSKLSLPAISTRLADVSTTTNSGSPKVFFFIKMRKVCAGPFDTRSEASLVLFLRRKTEDARDQAGLVHCIVFDFGPA